jgi:hypothetical protein
LPDYTFEPASGLWRYRDGTPEPPMSLFDVAYDAADGSMRRPSHRHQEPESRLAAYVDEAREILARPARALASPTIAAGTVGADFEGLRWFLLPEEVTGAFAAEGRARA